MCPPPIFGQTNYPYLNQGGGTLSPPSTTCPPGFSDLATALHNRRTEVGTELAESLASHGAFSRCILCTCFFLLVTMADKNALVKVLDRL